jgi:hypothetical protein
MLAPTMTNPGPMSSRQWVARNTGGSGSGAFSHAGKAPDGLGVMLGHRIRDYAGAAW